MTEGTYKSGDLIGGTATRIIPLRRTWLDWLLGRKPQHGVGIVLNEAWKPIPGQNYEARFFENDRVQIRPVTPKD